MRFSNRHAALAAIIAGMVWGVPALGIAAAPSPVPDPPSPQTVPESTEPGKSGSSTGPLGDKLNRTDGVIHPPAGVDPGISRAPPQASPGSTPVIPPPGTPGGDPAIQPK